MRRGSIAHQGRWITSGESDPRHLISGGRSARTMSIRKEIVHELHDVKTLGPPGARVERTDFHAADLRELVALVIGPFPREEDHLQASGVVRTGAPGTIDTPCSSPFDDCLVVAGVPPPCASHRARLRDIVRSRRILERSLVRGPHLLAFTPNPGLTCTRFGSQGLAAVIGERQRADEHDAKSHRNNKSPESILDLIKHRHPSWVGGAYRPPAIRQAARIDPLTKR